MARYSLSFSVLMLLLILNNVSFGMDMIRYSDFWVPVSDVEKTLIDFVYFGEFIPKDTLLRIRRSINTEKLREYLAISPTYVRRGLKRLLAHSY